MLIDTEHPIPFFSPKLLVPFRSQDVVDFTLQQDDLQIDETRIRPGEESHRLPPWLLEWKWSSPTPATSGLPFWARQDPVVLQINDMNRTPSLITSSSDALSASSSDIGGSTRASPERLTYSADSPMPDPKPKSTPKTRGEPSSYKVSKSRKHLQSSLLTRSQKIDRFYELNLDGNLEKRKLKGRYVARR